MCVCVCLCVCVRVRARVLVFGGVRAEGGVEELRQSELVLVLSVCVHRAVLREWCDPCVLSWT